MNHILYNGIDLPDNWPPDNIDVESAEPMPVPYLDNPPEVIPIDVGRQLFVDDFLIESSTLNREFHYPQKYEGNPIFKPETELELNSSGNNLAVACPKSGAIWYDFEDKIFKMWYEAGWCSTICYATSVDGLNWTRPELDIVEKDTNRISPLGMHPDSWSVVYDHTAENKNERYKIFVMEPCANACGLCFTSPDGLNWGKPVASGIAGDRTTMFYNPFRKKWCFSLRSGYGWDNPGEEGMRTRHYNEGDTLFEAAQWGDVRYKEERTAVPWAYVDKFDLPDTEIGSRPQLYNLDAVAYESLMLGMFEIHRGPSNEICNKNGTPKITDLNFAYSRDGFHWARPDRNAAIKSERIDAWDRGYVQPVGTICSVYKDKIVFYYTGFAGNKNKKSGMYDNGATGAAILRRDGFASMFIDGVGELTTRPVSFTGNYLFINANADEIKIEILDSNNNVIDKYSRQDSIPFSGDSCLTCMSWKEVDNLHALTNRPIKIRFIMTNGELYSFWISPDKNGKSNGYLAGGSPDYTNHIDK